MPRGSTLSLLSPEARVLLATVAGSERLAYLFEDPQEELDWGLLLRLSERERAVPVVWKALREQGIRRIPDEVGSAFQRVAMVSEFRMAALEELLRETVTRLAEQGIPVMLLKGAALGTTVYGSFVERPMLDLDLLVHEKDASAAWSRLEGQGWEQWERGPADPFYHGHHHLRPLLDTRGTETCLELHTAMLPPHSPFRLDVDRVWETGHRVRLGTDEAWTPSPEYLVVHLCIHLAWSHAFESRGWATFRDLAAVLDSTQVDWRRVKDLAGEARAESCCYWTLRLAGALVQLPLPAGVLETLAFPGPEAVKRVAERHLATTLFSADAQPCPSVALTRSLWSLALRPRRSGHGEARPWSSAEAYRNAMPGGHRDHGLVSRLGHQLSEYRAWIRYLLKILR